jgi:AraC-like DNA-binding protein
MSRNTFEIFHYRDETVQEVTLHHHDFYEVYFFLSGNVSYNIESRSYRLSPGDILLISPNELHQPIFSPEKQNYERIVLWLNAGFLQEFTLKGWDLTRCFNVRNTERSNLLRPDGITRELVNYLVQQLLREQDSEEFGSDVFCLSLLGQLLVMINRVALRAGQGPENRENTDSTVYRILTYINEHYNDDLNLDFLANKFFISKYHLSREFVRVVGTSVHRYILQKRLIMARQMMAAGRPTSEVYQHCGFGDYSNFYRAFKKEYQVSPREYLEELKQERPGQLKTVKLREPAEQ